MTNDDRAVPTAVVTGAGRGIGAAIARRLAADGFAIVAIDSDGEAAESTAAAVGGRAGTVDVADFDAVAGFAATVGPVDILVNNAGIWRLAPLVDAAPGDLRSVLDVNVGGTMACTRAFATAMRGRPGAAIVNISSAAARTASAGLGSYAASKAAVETLTRQWASELAPIRVNAVAPGLVVTEGTAANYEGEAGRRRAAAVPVGRTGVPDDIAAVVSFLVGPEAGYVNGQIITVDGGLSAGQPGR